MKIFELEKFSQADMTDEKAWLKAGEKVAEFMIDHCQPWIRNSSMGTDVFYRGVPAVSQTAFTHPISKFRTPKDTAPDTHRFFQTVLEEAGAVANRSNSVFVTKSRNRADEYGRCYVFAAIGPFNYTWAKDIDDWYEETRTFIRAVTNPTAEYWSDEDQYFSRFPQEDSGSNEAIMASLLDLHFAGEPVFEDLHQTINVDRGIDHVHFEEVLIKAEHGLYIDEELYDRVIMPIILRRR